MNGLKRILAVPILWALAIHDRVELLLIWIGLPYGILMNRRLERLRAFVGPWRAWRSHLRAYRRVPAYREHVDAHGGLRPISFDGWRPVTKDIPETDKKGYIAKHPIERIAVGGRLPDRAVVIDESSGSSGKATSWARGRTERMVNRRMLQITIGGASRDRKGFVINGLLLGTWAAGINVSTALADTVTIKTVGPDIDKIVRTIEQFGPGYRYFVMGYPPFLKMVADDDRIDWKGNEIVACFGGEGLSEELRTHLETRYSRVFGSYGAADLEVGLSGESDLTIRLRRAIVEDERVRAALIRAEHGVTPLVMQYDQLAYHIETNAEGELIFTQNRPWYLSPRVRYNLHDLGHVMRMPELRRILKGIGREDLLTGVSSNGDLPLLFLYRRSDSSVDYYGINVTPDGVREALHATDILAPWISTFKLLSYYDEKHDKKMEIAVELIDGARLEGDVAPIAETVFANLDRINDDFRNTRIASPAGNPPLLTLHLFGTGPFETKRAGRVKDDYIDKG